MIPDPSVLCPVDFSENSRGALRYAAAIASHLGARLTLLAVNDPLLVETAQIAHAGKPLVADTVREAETFCRQTFIGTLMGVQDVRLEIAAGQPAAEILRLATKRRYDLIVMGSHGSTGFRKLFFGSTTERVLRETTIPVLVTPPGDAGPGAAAEDTRKAVRRVLAPVDLSGATAHQVAFAHQVAENLHVPLSLMHVVEPVRSMAAARPRLPKIDSERRHRAERELEAAIATLPAVVNAEALIAYGEPAEEIAKVAAERDAGLIVMGLHSSPLLGPRMGSVTYRVLCFAHRLVLAIPPQPVAAFRLNVAETSAQAPAGTSTANRGAADACRANSTPFSANLRYPLPNCCGHGIHYAR